jgi:quercetin dioxygenase-like cupin family protein
MVNLKKLKDVTKTLNEMVISESNHSIEYNVDNGKCFGWSLYNVKEVAVQRAFLSKGSIFEKHSHPDEIEILIIYEGLGKIIFDDGEEIMTVGDIIKIEKGENHAWEILENTWMIGITIPASGDYPHA